MRITRASLEQRIVTLRQAEAQSLANVHAAQGAIQVCDALIAELQAAEQAAEPSVASDPPQALPSPAPPVEPA